MSNSSRPTEAGPPTTNQPDADLVSVILSATWGRNDR